MDCKEISRILNNPNRENLNVEIKQFDILLNLQKLTYQITAFANQLGGTLVIGAKDDGSLEGKRINNFDDEKGRVNNYILNKVSPVIVCSIELISCNDGDLILIEIPRKKDVPHAVVKKTTGGQILKREYRIRTSHGISNVSDKQLQYLFKEEEINFTYIYRFVVNYLKDSLEIPQNLKQSPAIQRSLKIILHNLPKKDLKFLLGDNIHVSDFILQIAPFLMLCNISHYFDISWDIKLNKDNIQTSNNIGNGIRITNDKIPGIPKNSKLLKLSINLKDYLNRIILNNFFLPINTKIEISIDDTGLMSNLNILNNDFQFIFHFMRHKYAWGSGIEPSHPQINNLLETETNFDINIYETYAHVPLLCYFQAIFNFPESNFSLFDQYYKMALNLRRIIEHDWNYESFVSKLPSSLLYSIDYKLKKILNHKK